MSGYGFLVFLVIFLGIFFDFLLQSFYFLCLVYDFIETVYNFPDIKIGKM